MTSRVNRSSRHQSAAIREPRSFGRRREPATITISRDGKERRFTIGPVFLSVTFSLVATFLVGYLGATAYLFFRDDLIGATRMRNARLMHEYESRIATLRASLDQVTSRQLLDRQAIETRIDELMRRQEQLRSRNGRIAPLLEEASKFGLTDDLNKEVPASSDQASIDPVRTGSVMAPDPSSRKARIPAPVVTPGGLVLRGSRDDAAKPPMPAVIEKPDLNDIAATESMFTTIAWRMDDIDAGQRALVDNVSRAATERAARIAKVLKKLNVPLPQVGNGEVESVGGPFIPATPGKSFDAHLRGLDLSLTGLQRLNSRLETVPLASPAPDRVVTSTFGTRIDPFLGRPAMHSGIDFRAPRGMPVKATARGIVTAAGRNGGYGNMVEIDHGDGIATRYAHLSRINVEEGQKVDRDTVIGLAGSTGRSTGPHVHYEVLRGGEPVNPARYLKSGRELAGLY